MKTIIRIVIAIFTFIIIAAATEEYRTFTTPFKQSRDGEKVILELPLSDLGTEGISFPKEGTYILNKTEVLERELEKQGYKVLNKSRKIVMNVALLALTLTFGALILNVINMKRSAVKSL